VKRIGLLGGTSWESSAEYYRLVNEEMRDRLSGLHSADCVLRSVDFAAIEELQRSGRWHDAGELLAVEARCTQESAKLRNSREDGVRVAAHPGQWVVRPIAQRSGDA
jgi:aspartate/glutamate racemase